jgi:hypothetical protein
MSLPPVLETLLHFYEPFCLIKGDQLIITVHYLMLMGGYRVISGHKVKIVLKERFPPFVFRVMN